MSLALATAIDFQHVRRMCVDFASSYPFQAALSEQKMDDLIWSFINGDKNERVLILYKDPHPVGMIAGLKTEILFSEETIASELLWWVDPSHRSGNTGFQLLEAYEFWAKKVGCKIAQMSSIETPIGDRLSKIYSRKGYQLVERGYLKEL